MQLNEIPDQSHTMTWSGGRGKVKFVRRSDGSRLRYFRTGTGPPLVLLHTVRTQLDYFQRVMPALWDEFTVRVALSYELCCGAASPITTSSRKTCLASCGEAAADTATRRWPEPACAA
jgi:hypothetical protein